MLIVWQENTDLALALSLSQGSNSSNSSNSSIKIPSLKMPGRFGRCSRSSPCHRVTPHDCGCSHYGGEPISPETGLSVPRRAHPSYWSYWGPFLRRAYGAETGAGDVRRARNALWQHRRTVAGSVITEASPHIPRRVYLSRGGLIYPEADLSVPRWAHVSRGGPAQAIGASGGLS